MGDTTEVMFGNTIYRNLKNRLQMSVLGPRSVNHFSGSLLPISPCLLSVRHGTALDCVVALIWVLIIDMHCFSPSILFLSFAFGKYQLYTIYIGKWGREEKRVKHKPATFPIFKLVTI